MLTFAALAIQMQRECIKESLALYVYATLTPPDTKYTTSILLTHSKVHSDYTIYTQPDTKYTTSILLTLKKIHSDYTTHSLSTLLTHNLTHSPL